MTEKQIYVDGKQMDDVQPDGSSAKYTEIISDGEWHFAVIIINGKKIQAHTRVGVHDAEMWPEGAEKVALKERNGE